mmetsp:Transcript_42950/g.84192  ORF Transcript_42950/g.84192 Transcript_42950/m.84192 type:complete len:247 (-) Transcript_42950:811-1551(-)
MRRVICSTKRNWSTLSNAFIFSTGTTSLLLYLVLLFSVLNLSFSRVYLSTSECFSAFHLSSFFWKVAVWLDSACIVLRSCRLLLSSASVRTCSSASCAATSFLYLLLTCSSWLDVFSICSLFSEAARSNSKSFALVNSCSDTSSWYFCRHLLILLLKPAIWFASSSSLDKSFLAGWLFFFLKNPLFSVPSSSDVISRLSSWSDRKLASFSFCPSWMFIMTSFLVDMYNFRNTSVVTMNRTRVPMMT